MSDNFLGYTNHELVLDNIYKGLGIPISMTKPNLEIFEQGWPGNDTVCGWGSTMEHTENIRHSLPRIIDEYNIRSINDAGCGDLFWIKHIDLRGAKYTGFDIYERSTWPELQKEGWKLEIADVTKDTLPTVDLTIVRDVFIHLNNHLVLNALDKIKTYSKYLLATNFVRNESEDVLVDNFSRIVGTSMHHSKINLTDKPFNLGKPLIMIPEDYPFKNTSLWRLNP